jgi:hypothetical protein
VDALVVDGPAGLLRLDTRPAPAPTGPAPREVPEERPQGQLLIGGGRG